MKKPLLLTALTSCLLALPSCSSAPEPAAPGETFVDTDRDGLPDQNARGAGFTATGQDTFVDTDGDGLPDKRVR